MYNSDITETIYFTAPYAVLVVLSVIFTLFIIRFYIFTLNRLYTPQRQIFDIDVMNWPSVTILVPAHNEEVVIGNALNALKNVDYPKDRLQIIVVNDRSTDSTREIIEDFIGKNPETLIKLFNRTEGKPGKAPALKDAIEMAKGEFILVFDADYLPGKGLIKQLVAGFTDPEVGLVMGRVVPHNANKNLLTKLLDLERSAGYQVDQQARMNMDLVPQYGGTVGGFRRSILESIEEWSDDALAEDTDITYRALTKGWKTAYINRSECYEEVPETWDVRVKQISRWCKGHNQVMVRNFGSFLSRALRIRSWRDVDAMFFLTVYLMPSLVLLAWLISIYLYFLNGFFHISGIVVFFSFISFSGIGYFAAFFQIAAATHLDGDSKLIRLLPFNFPNFVISMFTITKANLDFFIFDRIFGREAKWVKTERFNKDVGSIL